MIFFAVCCFECHEGLGQIVLQSGNYIHFDVPNNAKTFNKLKQTIKQQRINKRYEVECVKNKETIPDLVSM